MISGRISHLISLPTLKPIALALHIQNHFPRKTEKFLTIYVRESLKIFFDTFVMFILKEFPEEISEALEVRLRLGTSTGGH
jgi:hypothetical protein